MWKGLFKPRPAKATLPSINQTEEHATEAAETPVDEKRMEDSHDEAAPDNDAMYVLANFTGLLIVQGATEKRQIRYVMEVVCPTTRHKFECVKRFNQFSDLRQRSLDVLHQCRSKRCPKCTSVAATIQAQPFPGRRLFTTLQHVRERALPLEAFLQCVLDNALNWNGCKRSKHAFNQVASQFVGAPVDGMYLSSDRPSLDFRKSIRHLMVERPVSIGDAVADTREENASPTTRCPSLPQDSFEEEEHKENEDEAHPSIQPLEHVAVPEVSTTPAPPATCKDGPSSELPTSSDQSLTHPTTVVAANVVDERVE
ncbi:hypothetical protein H310_12577 [Aphanomyces invadans]|uniref:PX domain-containing protein n=1 Tax=Aphanomyces invadans TaxID=157072 RepID=A0A024TIZ6_9STRA|nr:hypothetical protein H310_12577 [Aphanomyces invadans]ETV93581.1 hypothetical protein H310_12577 [Aphanomyces invadans]|eukprot:XP_008877923.1 hypothetical protein H310_12577 [Aphanomyces invadans]